MSQSQEKDEGAPPSKTTLSEEHESQTEPQRPEQERADSPLPSCVSMTSDQSMGHPVDFKLLYSFSKTEQERADSPLPSCVSMKSDKSMGHPMSFKRVHQEMSKVSTSSQTNVDSIFTLFEENIVKFVKNKLKKFRKTLSRDCSKCLESHSEDEEVVDGEEEEQRSSSREAFLKITLQFMRRMRQEELADSLQNRILQSNLKNVNDEHQV